MSEPSRTTRERIADRLREEPLPAGRLAHEFDARTADILEHVRHVARSLDGTDEQLLVAPPECPECGFSDFDDLINRPSRCPECKHEAVDEPVFQVS